MEEPRARTTDLDHRTFTSWSADLMRISFTMFNEFPFPIEFFWNDESTEPVRQGILDPGNDFNVQSFLGHVFSAHRVRDDEDSDEPGEIVDFFAADGLNYIFR
jgi:hypothetical protein